MVTRAFFKDAFREIKKTFARFLAIVSIIGLGIAFFVGVKISCPDMKLTADKYFKDNNFMDFQLFSQNGMSPGDINDIKNTEGVRGVMPSFTIDALAEDNGLSLALRVHSMPTDTSETNPGYINRPNLIDGRLPEKSGECVIDKALSGKNSFCVGDKITLSGGGSAMLETNEFTITGLVNSPLYISRDRGATAIGSGQISAFIVIPETDFKQVPYTSAYVTVDIGGSAKAYGTLYERQTAPVKNVLEQKWTVLDRETNYGYVDYSNAAARMDAISKVFPVIFILVAVLICVTSIGRMVIEQRSHIGTLKALGYPKLLISAKFLLYALFAGFTGGVTGLTIGLTLFPLLIFKAYSALYTLPALYLHFDTSFAALCILSGILITCMSAFAVCIEELNASSAALMRPRAPKAGRKILLERIGFIWKHMRFSQKSTMRNIFRYKSRFLMTICGVGVCTALLIVGFGLNDSIKTIGNKQFGEIYTYQAYLRLKDGLSDIEINNIKDKIQNLDGYMSSFSFYEKSIEAEANGSKKNCNFTIPENASLMNDYINLRTRTKHDTVKLTEDGVVVTEKLADMLEIELGDEIILANSSGEKATVKVTGVSENYVYHYVYMSPALYESLFNTQPYFNEIYLKLDSEADEYNEQISQELLSLPGVSQIGFISSSAKNFNNIISTIYGVIMVLVVSAGLLTFIVLFILTNININERIREIATLKVLGFYNNEVSSYVFRENIILTILGTGLGLMIGSPLARYVIGTAEVDLVMFGRQIYPLSFIISALLTLFFAWVVNIVMIRRLRSINMVEALKSVE